MTMDATAAHALDALRAEITGPVLTAGDDGYAAEVAGFNLSRLNTPPIAVGAASPADVAATVRIAAAAGLPIGVVGSGHAEVPLVTRGILLTTRRLSDVHVDAGARTASVGAGCTWHDVMELAAPAGLAPVCGSAPAVGVIGFLLGGGLGPIARSVGFSSDHVHSFDIVCADGVPRTVSPDRDPDLFWALRGGKGGFGVVTGATVALLDLPAIYGGGEYYRAEEIPALLSAYQGFAGPAVPDELTTSLAILRLPDLPALPPPLRGQTVAHLRIAYAGAGERAATEAERLLASLRAAVDAPVFGGVGDLPYAQIGTIHNDPTEPASFATGGTLLDRLDADTAGTILSVAGPDVTTPVAAVEVRHFGGALARPGLHRDAVSGRGAAFGVWVASGPAPDAAALSAAGDAVRGILDALAPWSTGGVQINFCGSVNTAEEAARAWPADVADRLAAIRFRHDPGCLLPYVPGS